MLMKANINCYFICPKKKRYLHGEILMKNPIRLTFEKHDLDIIERNLYHCIVGGLSVPMPPDNFLIEFAEIHASILLYEKIRKRNSPTFLVSKKTKISFTPFEIHLILSFFNVNDPYQVSLKARIENIVYRQLLVVSDQIKSYYQ